ncbi:hypothetical protein OsJ_27739 [Oryza sativa Japonica Group]|uniref:Uncharacterized protein n=1 Tax=Oryza sativa subsp. japonica TaxID=39947 RepID=B9G1I3_ORYSJ|nr:hypothetical protein OsJ_27739 [Oryza sativa Japonica Group]
MDAHAPPRSPASDGGHGDGDGDTKKPHVLVVPYPAQGHMLPLLDLVALLAARGLALAVAVTPGNVPLLAPLLASCPPSSVATVTLPFPAASASGLLPAGCGENTKDLPGHLFRPFMASLAALRAPLLACRPATRSPRRSGSSSCGIWKAHASSPNLLTRSRPRTWTPAPGPDGEEGVCGGPLSDADGRCTDRGGKPAVAPARVAAWLDAFDDGSVLYVCFGTQQALSPAQAASLAGALGRSAAPFVWAARGGTPVPGGFEAATAARGMVIRGWAPQVEILRHRAVGWFLTHCGWNSVLEAVAAGVAMLAWPMSADQFTNAWLLAEAGVAVAVAEGADAVPDAGQMADAIASAIGNGGASVRQRAAELGRSTAAAVAEGGSSSVDLEELVSILSSPKLTN